MLPEGQPIGYLHDGIILLPWPSAVSGLYCWANCLFIAKRVKKNLNKKALIFVQAFWSW